jgi:FixJ family two-component response regulator
VIRFDFQGGQLYWLIPGGQMPAPVVISIVDDDESVRLALEGLVRSAGYTARTFASAEEFLGSSGPDETACLVTDIQMARMNGIDLHRHLVGQGHNIPVIFITAFPSDSVRKRATGPGVIAFLCKPFDSVMMLGKLAEAVQSA